MFKGNFPKTGKSMGNTKHGAFQPYITRNAPEMFRESGYSPENTRFSREIGKGPRQLALHAGLSAC